MSDTNTGTDAPRNDESGSTNTVTAENAENAPDAQLDGATGNPADGDVFPRSYVEELRKENGDHRTKAKDAEAKADALAHRLHAALVAATNRLENPADLPYDASHLDDADRLDAALDALLGDRPYLAKRVVAGDAGQGQRGGSVAEPTWADLFR